MKKILLSFVLLLGGVLFANAQTSLKLSSGWGTSVGFVNGITGNAVYNYKNAYGEVYADLSEFNSSKFNLTDYPSFLIVLANETPIDKLQFKVTTNKGDAYSGGIIISSTCTNAFTFVAEGSTEVTHLGLQAMNVENLGNVEIKEWNLIDKDNNKTPIKYKTESWSCDLISPEPHDIIWTPTGDLDGQYNYADIKGAENLSVPRFRFTISADEFPAAGEEALLGIKILTNIRDDSEGHGAIYRDIAPGTDPFTFDIDMDIENEEKITAITIFARKAYTAFNLTNVSATIQEVAPVEIGEYEWATFVSNKALDFTGSGIKAYAVTGHSGTTVTRSEALTKVPANTPLLLNAPQGSYNIPVITTASSIGTNLLKAGTGAAVSAESGKTKYVLSVTAGKAEFQKINTTAATVPTGKAYLEFNEAIEARSLDFDDEGTTAIKNMKVGENDNIYYDLQGRRVLYPKNGLYIVNGKKVIVK